MVGKLFMSKGKIFSRSKGNNCLKIASGDGVSNLEGTVQYEVSAVCRRGKVVSGKAHEDYAVAFASAPSVSSKNKS